MLRLSHKRLSDLTHAESVKRIKFDCRTLFLKEGLKNTPEHRSLLAALRQDGMALQHGSDEHRDNLVIVLLAVIRNPKAIQYASARLQWTHIVALTAVSRDGTVLRLLSPVGRGLISIVLAAVLQNGLALEYARNMQMWDPQSEKDVVLAAVRQNGLALKYARLQRLADKDIVLAAVRQNGLALKYASKVLQGDKDVVLAAVSRNGNALQYALYTNFDVLRAAFSNCGAAFRWLSPRAIKLEMFFRWRRSGHVDTESFIRELRELLLVAVQSDGRALRYMSSKQKADRDIVLAAVRQNGRALQYASSELLADYLVVSTAVRCSGVEVAPFVSDAHRLDPMLSPWLRLSPRACAWRRVRGAISRAAILAFWMHKTHLPHHAAMLQGMAAVKELLSPVPLGIDARVCSKCEHADTIDLQHELGGWWSGTLEAAFVSF